MNKKGWRTLGIIIGVSFLLFILFVWVVPTWVKLGVKPVCIQGDWPHLRIVSCPTSQSAVTPLPLPSLSEQGPIPIIVDDDGSPDGTIALLYFLRNPLFDVQAVTISCGEAHPDMFAAHISQLLGSLGRADIPVGAGRAAPLEGNNTFPEPWRQVSDQFWDIPLPVASVITESVPAAELIVDTINRSPQPVMLFISGTHTNLAEALNLDPGISENIRDVYIMGGSVYEPGNIHSDWPALDNTVAEWNIWVDPVAADEVFASGLPLHLIPLDATRRVMWTPSDLQVWQSYDSPAAKLAAELLQWMLDTWSAKGVYIWDLVAATQSTNPALCSEVSLSIDVVTSPGKEQGRTVAINGTPNTGVCLDPDSAQIKALANTILGGK
jgi:pyrimidine-specific ribonucleoside hydrolase